MDQIQEGILLVVDRVVILMVVVPEQPQLLVVVAQHQEDHQPLQTQQLLEVEMDSLELVVVLEHLMRHLHPFKEHKVVQE